MQILLLFRVLMISMLMMILAEVETKPAPQMVQTPLGVFYGITGTFLY